MILALIGGTMAAAYLIVVIICNVNDYRWYRAEVLRHARFVLLNRRRMERGKKPLFPLARPMGRYRQRCSQTTDQNGSQRTPQRLFEIESTESEITMIAFLPHPAHSPPDPNTLYCTNPKCPAQVIPPGLSCCPKCGQKAAPIGRRLTK